MDNITRNMIIFIKDENIFHKSKESDEIKKINKAIRQKIKELSNKNYKIDESMKGF